MKIYGVQLMILILIFILHTKNETVQEATINSMLGAMDEFGNWGPIELWVIGQDYEGVKLKVKIRG